MSRVYSARNLTWDGDVLRLNSREVARIVKDQTYPSMWRVKLPDGSLSDLANRTLIKDAAHYLALATLNRGSEAQETPSGRAKAWHSFGAFLGLPSGSPITGLFAPHFDGGGRAVGHPQRCAVHFAGASRCREVAERF
jgi:hypothetical protein